MHLATALLCGAFLFVLCVCILHWCSAFCDCIPHLCPMFVSCICILHLHFVSASCICVLHFPTTSHVTQLSYSPHNFFRCLLHRFLHTAVGFIQTCCTHSLASHGFIMLTQHCISPIHSLNLILASRSYSSLPSDCPLPDLGFAQ